MKIHVSEFSKLLFTKNNHRLFSNVDGVHFRASICTLHRCQLNKASTFSISSYASCKNPSELEGIRL